VTKEDSTHPETGSTVHAFWLANEEDALVRWRNSKNDGKMALRFGWPNGGEWQQTI